MKYLKNQITPWIKQLPFKFKLSKVIELYLSDNTLNKSYHQIVNGISKSVSIQTKKGSIVEMIKNLGTRNAAIYNSSICERLILQDIAVAKDFIIKGNATGLIVMIESVKDTLNQKIVNDELQDFITNYFLPLLQAIKSKQSDDIDNLDLILIKNLPKMNIGDDPALNFKYQLSRLADCVTALDNNQLKTFVNNYKFADKLHQFIFLTKQLNSFAIKTQTIIANQLMKKGVGFTSIDKRYEHVYFSEFNYLLQTNESWEKHVKGLYQQLVNVLYDKADQPSELKEFFDLFSNELDNFYLQFKYYLEQLIHQDLDLKVITSKTFSCHNVLSNVFHGLF